jgi:hypothetical protein
VALSTDASTQPFPRLRCRLRFEKAKSPCDKECVEVKSLSKKPSLRPEAVQKKQNHENTRITILRDFCERHSHDHDRLYAKRRLIGERRGGGKIAGGKRVEQGRHTKIEDLNFEPPKPDKLAWPVAWGLAIGVHAPSSTSQWTYHAPPDQTNRSQSVPASHCGKFNREILIALSLLLHSSRKMRKASPAMVGSPSLFRVLITSCPGRRSQASYRRSIHVLFLMIREFGNGRSQKK